MEETIAVMIPIVGFLCIVAIIKIITDARLRRRLAETHADQELVQSMIAADERAREEGSMKWGLIGVAVGVAFCLADLIELDPDQPGVYGLIIAAAGGALLLHHRLRQKAKA